MTDERKLTFDPDRFREHIFESLIEWMQTGIDDLSGLLSDPDHDRDDVQRDIGMVMRDGNTIVVVDITGGLHPFRMKLERL